LEKNPETAMVSLSLMPAKIFLTFLFIPFIGKAPTTLTYMCSGTIEEIFKTNYHLLKNSHKKRRISFKFVMDTKKKRATIYESDDGYITSLRIAHLTPEFAQLASERSVMVIEGERENMSGYFDRKTYKFFSEYTEYTKYEGSTNYFDRTIKTTATCKP